MIRVATELDCKAIIQISRAPKERRAPMFDLLPPVQGAAHAEWQCGRGRKFRECVRGVVRVVEK